MLTILLSIKPEYAHKILSGEKKYEYRKRIAKQPIDKIIIYSTLPEGKVIGEVETCGIINGSPSIVWKKTEKHSGIGKKDFKNYFGKNTVAFAYCLNNPLKYERIYSLKEFGINHAPQSFIYINDNIVEVVAAIICDKDKFMICQRPANKARGLLWEFVGGKVEPGETKEQALIRECREELAITVAPEDIFTDVIHEYPDITIHLTLYNCTIEEGVPNLLEHNDLKWITPAEIPDYDFCPADTEILQLIAESNF